MRQIRLYFKPDGQDISDINEFTKYVDPYFRASEIPAEFAGITGDDIPAMWQYVVYDLDFATEQRIGELRIPGYEITVIMKNTQNT